MPYSRVTNTEGPSCHHIPRLISNKSVTQNGEAAAAELATAEWFISSDDWVDVDDDELTTGRPIWTTCPGMTSDGDWR